MGDLSVPALVVVFLSATIVTWVAGIFLADSTDVLDDRFHLGEAIGGPILLGVAGTLPEIAITASAAIQGNLGIATGNLLGGIAMQTLVLVLLDATSGRPRPLSALVANTRPLNEAALVIGLVTIAIMGRLLPESTAIGPVSPMSLAVSDQLSRAGRRFGHPRPERCHLTRRCWIAGQSAAAHLRVEKWTHSRARPVS